MDEGDNTQKVKKYADPHEYNEADEYLKAPQKKQEPTDSFFGIVSISENAKPPGRRARKLKSTRDEVNQAAEIAAPSEDDSAKEFEGGENEGEQIPERTQSMDFENEESKSAQNDNSPIDMDEINLGL